MRLIWFVVTLVVYGNAAYLNKQPAANYGDKVRYDNYQVYKIDIKNITQLAIMEFFKTKSEKYNIWKYYDEGSKEIHVMVKPEEISKFLRILKFNNFEHELMINNVQELIDEEISVGDLRAYKAKFGWRRYYKLEDIYKWLDVILAKYANVTEGFVIGKSYENRDIRGIKISYKEGNPAIVIESNIHAREWITSASATWLINKLLTSKNKTIINLARNYDWYILPVLNVDGFVYSHTTDRLWRKTRQIVEENECIGTDPNRNFDSNWMENDGASDNPCSETYAGPKPFSEPEIVAWAKFLTSFTENKKIFLAFHSYNQLLLSPYGYTYELPPNYDDLQEIGVSFCDAIASLRYNTNYISRSTSKMMMFNVSGNAADWAYSVGGFKISYTISFRDRGLYGFVLPPVHILPNCEELIAGLIAMIGKAKELNYV